MDDKMKKAALQLELNKLDDDISEIKSEISELSNKLRWKYIKKRSLLDELGVSSLD